MRWPGARCGGRGGDVVQGEGIAGGLRWRGGRGGRGRDVVTGVGIAVGGERHAMTGPGLRGRDAVAGRRIAVAGAGGRWPPNAAILHPAIPPLPTPAPPAIAAHPAIAAPPRIFRPGPYPGSVGTLGVVALAGWARRSGAKVVDSLGRGRPPLTTTFASIFGSTNGMPPP